MSKVIRFLIVIGLFANQFVAPFQAAQAAEMKAQRLDRQAIAAVTTDLLSFAAHLDSLGYFGVLGRAIPLTQASPSDPQLLALTSLFGDTLGTASGSDLAGLRDDINNRLNWSADDAGNPYPGLDINFHAESNDSLSVQVNLERQDTLLPIEHTVDGVVFSGGEMTATVKLKGEFSFLWDADSSSLALGDTSFMTVTVKSAAGQSLRPFSSAYGFIEVDVGGTVTLDQQIDIGWQDPNSDGHITAVEWTTTALEDLVTVGYAGVGSTALNAAFELNAAQVEGLDLLPAKDSDLTLTVTATVSGTEQLVFEYQPSTEESELEPFTRLTADEMLTGFGQLTAALSGLQLAGDMKLPFMAEYMGDTLDFAEPVYEFVRAQGDADIVCGGIPTTPPSGSLANLAPGSDVYCQAYTLEPAQAVTWTINISPAVSLTGEHDVSTVGPEPDQNLIFSLPEGDQNIIDLLTLSYRDSAENQHQVIPRATTLQELFHKLQDPAYFDLQAGISYSPAQQSLVYTLSYNSDPPPKTDAQLDFGDKLIETTGLFALSNADAAVASVDPHDAALNVRFGVWLADGLEEAKDRFFLEGQGGQPIFQVDADVNAAIDLVGRLGFLEVSVTGDSDPQFQITNSTDNPMLELALVNTGQVSLGDIILTDVVTFTALFSDVTRHASPNCNVALTSTLLATAADLSAGQGGSDIGGGLTVNWPDVFDDACQPDYAGLQVVTSDAFSSTLQSFDASPSLFGTYSATVTSSVTLTDPSRNFIQLNQTRLLTETTLINLTDGSRCAVTGFDLHTLTCEGGLEGGVEGWWDPGDRYELPGDPQALLGVVLDALSQSAAALDGLAEPEVRTVIDQQLPLIAVSPGDLMPQFKHIEGVVNDIKSGSVDASILCGALPSALIGGRLDLDSNGIADDSDLLDVAGKTVTVTNGYITGPQPDPITSTVSILAGLPVIWTHDPSTSVMTGTVDLNGDGVINLNDSSLAPAGNPFAVPEGGTLYCQAFTSAVTQVQRVDWRINGGNSIISSTADLIHSVGISPTEFVTFIITGTNPTESPRFTIDLTFQDQSNHSGRARLPEVPVRPQTLQELATALSYRFGLGEDGLRFSVADLPQPGQIDPSGDGVSDLILELDYGICARDQSGASAIQDCSGQGYVAMDPLPVALNLGLEAEHRLDGSDSLPGLVGLESDLPVEFSSEAHLGFALSLEDEPVVGILKTTGVTVELGLASSNVDLQANAGAISVTVGTGAQLTGKPAYTNTATLTDTQVADFSELGVVPGDIVYLEGDGSSCAIETVETNTLILVDDCPISWQEEDSYRIGGQGSIRVGATFILASRAHTATLPLGDFSTTLEASLAGKPDGQCDGRPICGRLSVISGTEKYLGDLIITGTIETNLPHYEVTGTQRLASHVESAKLDVSLLSESASQLVNYVREEMDGNSSGLSVPLFGDALDGGAAVADSLANAIFGTIPFDTLNEYSTSLTASVLAQLIEDKLRAAIPTDTASHVGRGPLTVTLYCDDQDYECPANVPVTSVRDIRVTFEISQTFNYSVPLDIGIPGMPIGLYSTAAANAGWSLVVDFGVSRDYGPYIVTADHSTTTGPLRDDQELTLNAGLRLGRSSDQGLAECNRNDVGDGPLDGAGNPRPWWADHDTDRCITGLLGFLYVTMRDSNSDPTGVTVTTTLDIDVPSDLTGDIQRLDYQALKSGVISLTLGLEANANVDLRFRTGLRGVSGFPSVVGVLDVDWQMGISWTVFSTPTVDLENPSIAFNHLYLDAGEFLSQFVAPIAKEVKRITSPMMPVIDTVQAPLPVLSDLSRMVGGGDISLLTLMEATSGSNLTLLRRVIDFIEFANDVANASGEDHVWIPLGLDDGGSFQIDTKLASKGPASPGEEATLIKSPDAVSGSKLKSSLKDKGAGKAFSKTGSLSFPFLQQPMSIFGLLMGKDVTLVHFDAGTMRATASMEYTYRFAIGPVPVSVTLAGAATLEGRFAMGYDTYGMRRLATGVVEPSPGNVVLALLDGIYIDDLDRDGNDVPEISLKGSITARAGIDLVIVSAGVGGGIRLTVDLNLDDRPDPDGKLRISEIASKISNPWCLFEVSGRLEAFLEAWVKVNFFFYSKTWTFDLARIVLLEFSAACDPPNPVLAHVSNGQLVLNIGLYAGQRNIMEDEEDEQIVVRQLNADGTKVSVAGFGIHQEYTFDPGTIVYARAGDGNDEISLQPGVDANRKPISFTIASEIYGEDGSDRITGGDGADKIYGGSGDDHINAGGGNDCVYGGPNNDAIDGFLGEDVIAGEGGNDQINGGPAADYIDGGPGDDTIAGGPGSNKSEDEAGNTPDEADWLFGGTGDDTLQGGWGEDYVFGDQRPTAFTETLSNGYCELDPGDEPSDGGNDLIKGDAGDDFLFGGGGNDELYGGPGSDKLSGDAGHDYLEGDDTDLDAGNDKLQGDEGNDTLIGRAGKNKLFGGEGHDLLRGGPDVDEMFGQDGMDTLLGETGGDIMFGDDGENISGTWQAVSSAISGTISSCSQRILVIDGLLDLDGNNQVGAGDTGFFEGYRVEAGWLDFNRDGLVDQADSGLLNETAVRGGQVDLDGDGNAVNDRGRLPGVGLIGDEKNADCMYGGPGADLMFGGSGADMMFGDAGEDTMNGNEDGDIMRGGHDRDWMFGNSGDDHLFGDSGPDVMEGNEDGDLMRGGIGEDFMLGGSSNAETQDGDDEMYGDAGRDIMLGDNGELVNDPEQVRTLGPTNGGADRMWGNEDDDIIIGGRAGDHLYGGQAGDIILGDHGVVVQEGSAPDIYTTDPEYGDRDFIEGNEGDDIVLGGSDSDDHGVCDLVTDVGDEIYGNDGLDILLGDNGLIARADGPSPDVLRIATTDPGCGGADTIAGGEAPDIILGGSAGDTITGGLDDDTILGDQGVVARDDSTARSNDVWSTDPEYGGFDAIHGDQGDDVIIGGSGPTMTPELTAGDELSGDDGQDVIVGDNAFIWRDAANVMEEIVSTYPDSGDVDTAYGGNQSDLILGGYDGDWLNGDDHSDIILGDNGRIVFKASGGDLTTALDYVRSIAPTLGGSDVISGSLDADLVFGGTLSDTISGGEGPDILLGDHGEFNSAWPVEQNFRSIYTSESSLGAGDSIHGDAGDDFILGQQGEDEIYGDEGEDDLTGGHNVDGGADAGDYMDGGPEDDVMLGDNGVILRQPTASGWQRLTGGDGFDMAVRETTVSLLTSEGTYGDDTMVGGSGHDDMYGQLGDDYMEGNGGEDAMVGDLGRITNAIEDGSREQIIRSRSPFLESTIYAAGSLLRSVELFAFDEDLDAAGGDDIMLGGDQADSLHGGPGDDLLNGDGDASSAIVDPEEATDNRDSLFGGDGADAIWGGRGDDHLFGGRGDDYLDVLPRAQMTVGKKSDPMTLPADPDAWFKYALNDNYQGADIIYGGWDQDAMQADVGGPGKAAGDRLLDWVGAYNVYYVCGGAYGEGRITRSLAPNVIEYLQQLAEADGAAGAGSISDSSGALELAMVFAQDASDNSHAIHDDHPGHFTCENDQSAASSNDGRAVVGGLTDPAPAQGQQQMSGCAVPGDHATIQAAVDDPGCDLISVGAGTFTETIRIERTVMIQGQGAAATIVDGSGIDHVFNIQAATELDHALAMTVTIKGLTITNGDSGLYAVSKNVDWDPGYGSAHLTVSVADCAISDNNGSGVRASPHDFGQTEIHISGTAIDGNSGPGVSNLPGTYGTSHVELVNSMVSNNAGGGILNFGCSHGLCNATLDVASSTIHGNAGSGIYSFGPANVTNSTISGNTADEGGGIYACGTTNLLNTTVTSNEAGVGGGLYIVGGDTPYGCRGRVVASNTIVANSATGGDCALSIDTGPWAATFSDAGHNIIDDGTCIEAPTSRSGDPLLGPLADNDGPTLTHALTPLSPAIDAGDDAVCTETDQRGRPRPKDGDGDGTATCDIGSFEAPLAILYVTPTGDGDCSSWASACSLQDALDAAASGDEIWVAEGIHRPGVSVGDSFWLQDGVAVFGGFAGWETRRGQRDWESKVTILSGDLAGDDTTDANGVITDTTRIVGANAYHVVRSQGVTASASLDGFTITGGTAILGYGPDFAGGGMRNDQSQPTLANLIFRGNMSSIYGGGLYNNMSSPTLRQVSFHDNAAVGTATTAGYGGGMYNNYYSNPTLRDVIFQDNSAADYGGGMRNWYNSNPVLRDVVFVGNSAGIYGGGLGNRDYSNPTLTNVSFISNTASLGGGLANQDDSGTTMVNVIFNGNTADYGGGLFTEGLFSTPLVKMTNALFSGNRAYFDGGAIESRGCVLDMRQVTLANNHAADHGGGLNVLGRNLPGSAAQVSNSIFWGNTASYGGQLYNVDPAVLVSLDHVLIQGGCPENTFCGPFWDADPLFVDPDGQDGLIGTWDDDLKLQEGSPAVDVGENGLVPVDELDLDEDGITDGESLPVDLLWYRRFFGNAVDLGACEWQEFYQFLPTIVG